HILNTFSALLRIASIESGQQKNNFSNMRLDDIVQDVVDLYDPLAEEKDIALHVKTVPAHCFGDKDLIFQAIANVLDNAIKFTSKGGTITIALTENKKI